MTGLPSDGTSIHPRAADFPKASCIGTLLLSATCYAGIAVTWVRYSIVSLLTDAYPKWNKAGLVLGLVGSLGGAGVAAFQAHIDIVIHSTFANLFFVCTPG